MKYNVAYYLTFKDNTWTDFHRITRVFNSVKQAEQWIVANHKYLLRRWACTKTSLFNCRYYVVPVRGHDSYASQMKLLLIKDLK